MCTGMIVFIVLMNFFLINADDVCPTLCVCGMTEGLRRAKCTGQRIHSIEADIPSQVQYLDFSDNVISSLPDYGFKELNMINLIVMNISHNMIQTISLRAFYGLNHLQSVDLSFNVLHTLAPDIFEQNTKLKYLNLAGNKFVSLKEDLFLESNSLEILDISKCLIPHVYPIMFLKLPNLTKLDLHDNLLQEIEVIVIDKLLKLKKFNLLKNPIKCNSKINELQDYLRKKLVIFENPCVKEEKFQKMMVMDEEEIDEIHKWVYSDCDIDNTNMSVQNTNTTCSSEYEHIFSISTMVIIIFLIGFIFGVSFACLCVSLKYITKRKHPVRTQKLRNRRREDLLLSEFDYAPGMSTPVLNRVQRK